MSGLWSDVKFGFRMLKKNLGFTAVAVITLALGIGANTAIFSVVNALLIQPLPFDEPERLVWIERSRPGSGDLSSITSKANNFKDWRELNRSFEDLGAYFAFFDYGNYNLLEGDEPERLIGVGVSQSFLDVLGVQPFAGRIFNDDECRWQGPKAVLLTHKFWQRRFGADPSVIGRSVSLNNEPYSVVGVLPSTFDFSSIFVPGSNVDILTPFPISDETDQWGNTLAVVGRLKPGVTMEAAYEELDLLNKQVLEAHPERGSGYGVAMTGLQEHVNGRFKQPIMILFFVVICVLLIACANLANLLFARAVSRRKEIAVRTALGARRWRLMRQTLVESMILALCGAAAGLPLAYYLTDFIATSQAFDIPLLQRVTVDGATLLFTLGAALFSGLLFGTLPVLQISVLNLNDDLKDATRGSSEGRQRSWVREVLVVSEVAMACVLLIGAGLLVHSFMRLLEVDPGFRPENTISWRIESGRVGSDLPQQISFYNELIRTIEALPGVESAGLSDALPLGRNRSWTVRAQGETYAQGEVPSAFPRVIDRGYLQTMKIPLRSGRFFNDSDKLGSENSLIINEAMARGLWSGRDAVDQVVLIGDLELRVVGIVGDVRHSAMEEEAGYEIYLSNTQFSAASIDLVVRTKMPEASMVSSIRTALKQVDPALPTAQYQTMGDLIDQSVSPRRFVVLFLGGFSILALVLASLGIFGVISYSVSRRTQEIGIRMAFGAKKSDVLKLVVGQGLSLVLIGIALGLTAGFVVTRLIRSQLYEVTSTDPLSFACAALLLIAVAFLACYLPARRAAKVDPMTALRYE